MRRSASAGQLRDDPLDDLGPGGVRACLVDAQQQHVLLGAVEPVERRRGGRFLAVADHLVDLPPWVRRVLRQIPPAALATIVVPAFVRPHGELDLVDARLAAGIVATLVAWRTRNAALTLTIGMGVLVLLDPWW